MYRYIRFYESIIKELDLESTSKFTEEENRIFCYIYKQLKKNDCVMSIEDAEELKDLVSFDLEKHIFCYLKKRCEINELLRVDKKLEDEIELKIKETRTKGATKFNTLLARRILNKAQGNYIKAIYFRRLEKILGVSLEYCIISKYDTATKQNKKIVKDRYRNIIHALARRLSNYYNYGYSINYNQKTLLLEKNNVVLVYWIDDKVYENRKYLFDLNENVSTMAILLDSHYKSLFGENLV